MNLDPQTDAALDKILNSLKIASRPTNTPPYTEDNKPQGIIFVAGIAEAKQQLAALLLAARKDEQEQCIYVFNHECANCMENCKEQDDRLAALTQASPSQGEGEV